LSLFCFGWALCGFSTDGRYLLRSDEQSIDYADVRINR
jgi:hypothetical protein